MHFKCIVSCLWTTTGIYYPILLSKYIYIIINHFTTKVRFHTKVTPHNPAKYICEILSYLQYLTVSSINQDRQIIEAMILKMITYFLSEVVSPTESVSIIIPTTCSRNSTDISDQCTQCNNLSCSCIS